MLDLTKSRAFKDAALVGQVGGLEALLPASLYQLPMLLAD